MNFPLNIEFVVIHSVIWKPDLSAYNWQPLCWLLQILQKTACLPLWDCSLSTISAGELRIVWELSCLLRYLAYSEIAISFLNKVARMVLFQFKICPRPNFFTVMSAHFVTWLFISSSALTCVNPPPHMLSSKCTELFPFPRRGQVLCPLDHHIWVCLQLFSFLGFLKLDPIHLQLTVKFNTVQSLLCTPYLWEGILLHASTAAPSATTEHSEHWKVMHYFLVHVLF